MDGLWIFLVVLLGAVSRSHNQISGAVLEVTVRPGDNITLYCDCKTSSGALIVWYRNCSHVNQPSLVLKLKLDAWREMSDAEAFLNPLPRFHFVKNQSSKSYDLLITDITGSDEGLFYCGTEQTKVGGEGTITPEHVRRYGKTTTRILLNSTRPHHDETPSDCGVCWMLLYSLCPAFAVLSSLLSSIVVHHYCQKTAKEPEAKHKRSDSRSQTRENQDEDICYAALDIRPASQKPRKKHTQSSEFSTYSAINTRRT